MRDEGEGKEEGKGGSRARLLYQSPCSVGEPNKQAAVVVLMGESNVQEARWKKVKAERRTQQFVLFWYYYKKRDGRLCDATDGDVGRRGAGRSGEDTYITGYLMRAIVATSTGRLCCTTCTPVATHNVFDQLTDLRCVTHHLSWNQQDHGPLLLDLGVELTDS